MVDVQNAPFLFEEVQELLTFEPVDAWHADYVPGFAFDDNKKKTIWGQGRLEMVGLPAACTCSYVQAEGQPWR